MPQVIELPMSAIKVDRDSRQRRKLTGIEELAGSISRIGLLHPIVVDDRNVLIAGERRYCAHQALGLPTIAAHRFSDLSESARIAIELEENIRRQDISWEDRVTAVRRYHELRGLSTAGTADELGFTEQYVNQLLSVAKEIEDGNTLVAAAPRLTTAIGITQRVNARRADADVAALRSDLGLPSRSIEIRNEDFIKWAKSYNGPLFTALHCDFPYGIGAGGFVQGSGASFGGYEDSFGTYRKLCTCLAEELDRIATPNAHMIFWFSMKHYEWTFDQLSTDWQIVTEPLIWSKGSVGIAARPDYWPRNCYETAFFCYRGDARLVQTHPNIAHFPIVSESHMSEKNEDMLKFFLRMIVDDNTSLLDPTCGSGSAIRAAQSLGARRALGLEINDEYATDARRRLDATG
jgi:ParB family transcriptional regulator, chromosome partitioning protein